MVSDPRLADDLLALPGPYPRLDTSPLGCALGALAGAEVPVLFCGPRGSGCRWLARTLHALRNATLEPVELDLEHTGGLALDDALVMRQLRRRRDHMTLIVHGLEYLSAAGQSALGDLVDELHVRVLASCRPGDSSERTSRSLRDRFLDIQVPRLSARRELAAIVRAFLRQQAELAGVDEPEMKAGILPLLGALGWPQRLADIAVFARDAVDLGDVAAAAALALATTASAPARSRCATSTGCVVSLRRRPAEV